MSHEIARLLRIRGAVQGVGYRAFLQEHATRLGLRGWARNRSDGSVEALIGGEGETLLRLIALLRRGPPGAHVSQIEESEATPGALEAYQDSFVILPTL